MEEDDDDNEGGRPNLEYVPNPNLDGKLKGFKNGSNIAEDPLQSVLKDYDCGSRYINYPYYIGCCTIQVNPNYIYVLLKLFTSSV